MDCQFAEAETVEINRLRRCLLKGYYAGSSYFGYDPETGKYEEFATEQDYVEWFNETYNIYEDGGLDED